MVAVAEPFDRRAEEKPGVLIGVRIGRIKRADPGIDGSLNQQRFGTPAAPLLLTEKCLQPALDLFEQPLPGLHGVA